MKHESSVYNSTISNQFFFYYNTNWMCSMGWKMWSTGYNKYAHRKKLTHLLFGRWRDVAKMILKVMDL